jgi:type I restriction-modification system DNA methylase subunit
LGEIENVQAEIKGEQVDQQKTRRKKDGIFYTPKYITKYIVENTVGKLCSEKRTELDIIDEEYAKGRKNRKKETIKALDEKLIAYRNWMLSLTILDPACGSGAFLNQALEFLIKEHHKIDDLRAQLFGSSIVFSDITTDILEKNIYGVDLNEESVEIAKLSLWLRTAQKGRKLNALNNNIKCGNSLIDDPEVAGDKAFNWQNEFPEIFANGGFDVVIGNPPYVRAELLGFCRSHLEKNYSVFNPSGDLFSYFYEKSFKLLKEKTGLFGFISNTFDKTAAGINIREYLQSKIVFIKYIDFTEVQIFEGATTYPVIIIAKNYTDKQKIFNYIKIPKADQASVIDIDFHSFVEVAQTNLNNESWSFISKQGVNLIDKLKNNKSIKEIYKKSYRGLLTGLNEAFIIPKSYQQSAHIKHIFEGKEIEKWTSPESVQQLILFESRWTKLNYGNDISEESALSKMKCDFPQLMKQILQFEKSAKIRFDKGDFFWELRNCAYYDLFEKPKIVFPNLQNSNKFSYDETGAYINAPAVILPTEDKFLVAILNSKIVWYFLTSICVVRSGGYIEVKPQYFEQIPIPEIPENIKIQLTELTNQIISNTILAHLIKTKLIKLLTNKFENITITKRLDNWYDLSFSNFQKELLKQKIKLSLSDEAEWMDFFAEQSKQYSNLINSIKMSEKEIDQLVYQLYGLTEEEITIVENK